MSEIPKGACNPWRNRIWTPDMCYGISIEDCISNMGCHIAELSITELSLIAIDLLRDFTNLSL